MSNTKTTTVKRSSNDLDKAETALVSSSVKPKKGGCGACCRSILAFLASTLGLTILAVGYAAVGGYIFMVLESPDASIVIPIETSTQVNPVRIKVDGRPSLALDGEVVRASLAQHLELLWNMTEQLNVFYKDSWTEMAEEILRKYTNEVFEAVRVNETTGSGFESTTDSMKIAQQVEVNQWDYTGSLLYAITVVTTIGYGHITPKTHWGMIVTMIYAVFGIPLTFLTIAHLGRIMATAFRFLYRNVCCIVCRVSRRRRHKDKTTSCPENGTTAKQETEVTCGEPTAKKRIRDVKVPISVTVVVLIGYIALGSLLFSIWEGWGPVEASYFCFITLSTIGFGDFVPGMSLETGRSHEKLLCCALYLLLGLSFLAMCFDLIQEEVVNKFRRLGRSIGLVKDSK